MPVSTRSASKINSSKFYLEWSGHPIEDLEKFLSITQEERPNKPVVYLAGDSSLDNKYWVALPEEDPQKDVPEIYKKVFQTPKPKPDVAYWMNKLLEDRATCINTSIEESMLRQRDGKLLKQDEFIRDNIRSQDVLIVSVGANDIAMKPLPYTILHMLRLAWFTKLASLENKSASSLKYFAHMFGPKIQDYVNRVTSKTKPRAVIVCMIYYPLEAGCGQKGWANHQLRALGYNSYPSQLQTAIRAMYELATDQIKIDGTEIIPCKLYEVLDEKDKNDYIERVEPSEEGGRKMAVKFLELLEGKLEGPVPETPRDVVEETPQLPSETVVQPALETVQPASETVQPATETVA